MTGFWWNCVLAAAWLLITGDLTILNALFGFLIGTGVLILVGQTIGVPRYLETVGSFAILVLAFLRDLTLANLLVAHDLLTPKSRLRPGIIRIPLDAKTDNEISILANMLTLTPGTTSIDISDDRTALYLHVMYLDKEGPEATRDRIKHEVEARLLRVTR